MTPVEIYDPVDLLKALEVEDPDDGGFLGPEEEQLRRSLEIPWVRSGLDAFERSSKIPAAIYAPPFV